MVRAALFVCAGMLWVGPAFGAAETQPAETQGAVQDPIHNRLQHAKDEYDGVTEGARRRLAAYLGTREESAQKRGDLAEVKSFEGMKGRFEKEGVLPESPVDAALRDNVNNYLAAVRLSTKQLAGAYKGAVRDYTKAGLIDQADVVQAEADVFEKGGTAGGNAAGAAGGGAGSPAAGSGGTAGAPVGNGQWFVFTATSGVPKYFESNPEVVLSGEGLGVTGESYLRTAKTDFINSDFVFEAIVTVGAQESLKMGMGQGSTGKPGMQGIEMNRGVALAYAVGLLGKVAAGTHLLHVEKKGMALTSAVVLNYSGKYSADYVKTTDVRHLKYLTAENSRLFLEMGPGVVVKQVRLVVP